MSGLDEILKSDERLDVLERAMLVDWLEALKDDCRMFGATGEDIARMNAIRRRLGGSDTEGTPE
jgi:hypothetical protein